VNDGPPVLEESPTVTTTLPVLAPVGTSTTIEVLLQLIIEVAFVPLNETVLVPCVEPKFVPVMVIPIPMGPSGSESGGVMVGTGVADTTKLADVVAAV